MIDDDRIHVEEQGARTSNASRRPDRSGPILAIALVLASALMLHQIARRAFLGDGRPPIGSVAPGFVATRLSGETLALNELRGRVVLLDFWATWCPPCVGYMPGLQRLHREYASVGLTVVGVNQEPGQEPVVRSFVAGRGLSFPMVVDTGSIADAYGVSILPTTFLIDRTGVVRAAYSGLADDRELARWLEQLLDESPNPD